MGRACLNRSIHGKQLREAVQPEVTHLGGSGRAQGSCYGLRCAIEWVLARSHDGLLEDRLVPLSKDFESPVAESIVVGKRGQ